MRVSMSDFSRLQRDLAKDASVVAWLQNIQDVIYDRLMSKPIPRALSLEVSNVFEDSDGFAKPAQVSQKQMDRINNFTGASVLINSKYVTSEAKRIVERYPKIKDLNSVQLSRLLSEVYKKVDTHIGSAPTATPSYPDPGGPTRFGHQSGLPDSLPVLETNVTYQCDTDLLNEYNTCRVRVRRDSNIHAVIGYGGTFLGFGACMLGSAGTLTLGCAALLTGGLSSASLWTFHTYHSGYQDCEDDYSNHGCPCKVPHRDFPDEFQDCELDQDALDQGANAPTSPIGGSSSGPWYFPGPLPGSEFQLPGHVGIPRGGRGGIVEVSPPVGAGNCRSHYSAADCQAMF